MMAVSSNPKINGKKSGCDCTLCGDCEVQSEICTAWRSTGRKKLGPTLGVVGLVWPPVFFSGVWYLLTAFFLLQTAMWPPWL